MFFKLAETLLTTVVRETARGMLRTYNGARLAATEAFHHPPSSPSRLLINQRLLKLRRYISSRRNRSRLPVLLIPPLMVKPDIYDLCPENSFVRDLLARRYDVFLVDFGAPERRDRNLLLDDFITKRIHRAVRKVKQTTGHQEISLVGYCMGGVFANVYAALHPQEGIRNVVSISAPTDFSALPAYQTLGRVFQPSLFAVADHYGYLPAALCRTVFQLTQPVKTLSRPFKLFWNLWDEDYVATQQAIRRWMNDFVNFPQAAFEQFWNLINENNLYHGTFMIGGRPVDLSHIQASYLALAGAQDHLVPPQCALAIMDLLPGGDQSFEILPGGHLGILIGSRAPKTWEYVSDWLAARSRAAQKLRFRRLAPKRTVRTNGQQRKLPHVHKARPMAAPMAS